MLPCGSNAARAKSIMKKPTADDISVKEIDDELFLNPEPVAPVQTKRVRYGVPAKQLAAAAAAAKKNTAVKKEQPNDTQIEPESPEIQFMNEEAVDQPLETTLGSPLTLELSPSAKIQFAAHTMDVPDEALHECDDEAFNDWNSDGDDMPKLMTEEVKIDDVPECPDWWKLFSLHKYHFALQRLARDVYVSLPCVGVDGCTRALETMKVKFTPTNVYDLEAGYHQCLDTHYKEAGVKTESVDYHLGVEKGEKSYKSKARISMFVLYT